VALDSTTEDQAEMDGQGRLEMQDEEHTNEQATVRFSKDGTKALYAFMRTNPIDQGGTLVYPEFQVQCSLTALETYQLADGTVSVRRPAAAPYDKFVTDNDGNEYRNCHKPELVSINGDQNVALFFNYQDAGSGDTKRWVKIFDWLGNEVTLRDQNGQPQEQVVVMAKDNDDCSMHQSGDGETGAPDFDEGGVTEYTTWAGCNGNGDDDGWANHIKFECTGAGAGADCTVTKEWDVSLAQREERSRGRCTVGGADRSFAVCTWTEGNTQPQRDGVWIAAVDLNDNVGDRVLWKEQISQVEYLEANGEMREYYAMRAQHARILTKTTAGELIDTDEIMFQASLNRGGNNNDKKGGRSDAMEMAVIKTTRQGFTFTMPLQIINMTTSPMFAGFDATHNSGQGAIFGKGDQLIPGYTLLNGVHTAASGRMSQVKAIGYDPVTKQLINLGTHVAAPYDRHLYSNYLGNNPGNQGRNFAGSDLFKNPFEGVNGNMVQYISAFALTGKPAEHLSSAIKPSAFLTLMPVAFSADAPDPGGDFNDNLPGDEEPDAPEDPDVGGEPARPSGTIGGACQSGGGSSAGGLVLLGVALLVTRRRRRA
jgi:MYXO-CTERM domain-containing protein